MVEDWSSHPIQLVSSRTALRPDLGKISLQLTGNAEPLKSLSFGMVTFHATPDRAREVAKLILDQCALLEQSSRPS